jgi:hypothetical protein
MMQNRPHPGLRAIKLSLVAAVGLIALLALPSLASARDRNHDRIPDRWEKRHNLSLRVNQARRDQDHDGLRNRPEFLARTDPRDRDSDNDGTEDGDENAGTIATFDNGVLTIDLFGGGSVSGQVTDDTEIECENEEENGDDPVSGVQARHDGGDNSGPGDNSGSGDNSGPGNAEENENEDEDEDEVCTTADLTKGAVVHEAELELEDGQAIFEEVELVG